MKTYDYLQYRLSDVLRLNTATVSDNLASESTLDIPAVYFYAETWKELCDMLIVKGESDLSKNMRFPFIALVGNDEYDINRDQSYPEVSCTIIIVTKSDPSWRSEQRVSVNYNPILYPIYTEFLEVVALSHYFQGPYNPYPAHKCIENYNLGEQGATGGTYYKLNDNVDGLILTNFRLRLNRPRIAAFQYGPTTSLHYLNNVSELTCSNAGRDLTITLDAAQYTDNITFVGVPVYTIVFIPLTVGGDTDIFPITIGGSYVRTVTEEGEQYGYIECNDGTTSSKLYFYYSVYGGTITKITTQNKFKLDNFQLNGFAYPDYPFDVIRKTTSNKSVIELSEILIGGGNVIESIPYVPPIADTTAITTTITEPKPTAITDVGCNVVISGPSNTSTLLESISYYKLL